METSLVVQCLANFNVGGGGYVLWFVLNVSIETSIRTEEE